MTAVKGNPVKEDTRLVELTSELDGIQTRHEFNRWKDSFLQRFVSFLSQDGIFAAQEAYDAFSKSVRKLTTLNEKLQGHLEKGELSTDRVTVKARLCLSNLHAQVSKVVKELQNLLPTGQESAFSTFQMGAVLIRDGFQVYDTLVSSEEVFETTKPQLVEVADKQVMAELDKYAVQLRTFCDILADLGLYEAMRKSREVKEDGAPGEGETATEWSCVSEEADEVAGGHEMDEVVQEVHEVEEVAVDDMAVVNPTFGTAEDDDVLANMDTEGMQPDSELDPLTIVLSDNDRDSVNSKSDMAHDSRWNEEEVSSQLKPDPELVDYEIEKVEGDDSKFNSDRDRAEYSMTKNAEDEGAIFSSDRERAEYSMSNDEGDTKFCSDREPASYSMVNEDVDTKFCSDREPASYSMVNEDARFNSDRDRQEYSYVKPDRDSRFNSDRDRQEYSYVKPDSESRFNSDRDRQEYSYASGDNQKETPRRASYRARQPVKHAKQAKSPPMSTKKEETKTEAEDSTKKDKKAWSLFGRGKDKDGKKNDKAKKHIPKRDNIYVESPTIEKVTEKYYVWPERGTVTDGQHKLLEAQKDNGFLRIEGKKEKKGLLRLTRG